MYPSNMYNTGSQLRESFFVVNTYRNIMAWFCITIIISENIPRVSYINFYLTERPVVVYYTMRETAAMR